MPESPRVTVRLNEETLERAEQVVEAGKYQHISDLVRSALREELWRSGEPQEAL